MFSAMKLNQHGSFSINTTLYVLAEHVLDQMYRVKISKSTTMPFSTKIEQNIPLFWLYEKLVALHVRCLNLTVSLKQPMHARY
jgi:hypothetical protein